MLQTLLKGAHFCDDGARQNVYEMLHNFFKIWAMECKVMMLTATATPRFFGEQGQRLELMAESMKKAGNAMRRYSASANEKARVVWMSLPEAVRVWKHSREQHCAAEIQRDLQGLAVDSAAKQPEHIKSDIKNALSFLESDPEVALVVEAHAAVRYGHELMDTRASTPARCFLLKHAGRGGCGCSFEVFACQE